MSDAEDNYAALSEAAKHIFTSNYFGNLILYKPILLAPRNDEQEAAFQELLAIGYVHGDVERGVYGYRATMRGRDARNIVVKRLNDEFDAETAAVAHSSQLESSP